MYILINGKKRVGKNYVSEMIAKELHSYGRTSEIMAYADPIKDILEITFKISPSELDTYKNKAAHVIIDGYICSNFRNIIQNFGTEAMKKHFGENVWVDLLKAKAEKSKADYIIISDFRFISEYIPGSITIKVLNNDLNTGDTHKSENELNDFKFHYIIDNTSYQDISSDIKDIVTMIL